MIGEKFRQIRKTRRFTIEALVTKSGVNRTTIWKIETGGVSPTTDTLQKLADAMGVSVAVFFENCDDKSVHREAS